LQKKPRSIMAPESQAEVSVAPHATINGDLIAIHGVRNFDYRTETDFTPRSETRTYDLSKLDSVDLAFHKLNS
jgi:hypothetical protein